MAEWCSPDVPLCKLRRLERSIRENSPSSKKKVLLADHRPVCSDPPTSTQRHVRRRHDATSNQSGRQSNAPTRSDRDGWTSRGPFDSARSLSHCCCWLLLCSLAVSVVCHLLCVLHRCACCGNSGSCTAARTGENEARAAAEHQRQRQRQTPLQRPDRFVRRAGWLTHRLSALCRSACPCRLTRSPACSAALAPAAPAVDLERLRCPRPPLRLQRAVQRH